MKNLIAELELNVEWRPKIVWIHGSDCEPIGIKRDGLSNAQCLEKGVNEYLARSLVDESV